MSAITPLISFAFRRDWCMGNVFYSDGSRANAAGFMSSLQSQVGCLSGDGISSASKVVSSLSVNMLKDFLGTKDFAIEMWLRPKLNVTADTTIFTVGIDSLASSKCKNNLAVRLFYIFFLSNCFTFLMHLELGLSSAGVEP